MSRENLERDAAVAWLMMVTKQYRDSAEGQSGKYVPYPATWLRAQRYFDDPESWNRREPDTGKPARSYGQELFNRIESRRAKGEKV